MADNSTKTAFIGLLGVLLGGFLTFGVEAAKEYFDRKREAENVTRALLVEIRELNETVIGQRNWWRTLVNPKEELQPLIPYRPVVYGHFSAKLDLLDPELAARVEQFYNHVQFINDFQAAKQFYDKTPSKRIDYYCRYDRILGLRYEEKFGVAGQSVFSSYYAQNGLGEENKPKFIAPEPSVCRNTLIGQQIDN